MNIQDTNLKTNIEDIIQNMISELLNKTFTQERQFYLQNKTSDKANGYLPQRNIKYGTEDIPINIPRTRNGFYPTVINKYQKSINQDYSQLLRDLIFNCKNIKSLKMQAAALGLPYKEQQIENLINELYEEAQEINNKRLESDYYVIYIDAKVIDLKFDDEKHVTKATHFTVVGLDTEAYKHILYCSPLKGNESLSLWRDVLHNLKNRGVTRVSLITTDDFSGLNDLIKSMFPQTHHQLCTVHLMRKAQKHLAEKDYQYFKKSLHQIFHRGDYKRGYAEFLNLCDYLCDHGYKDWSNHLRKRSDNYTSALHFPEHVQKHLKSTNSVEGINNDIEIYKRTSGGYFHSERDLMVKMKILIENKYQHKWKYPIPIFKCNLYEINQLFLKQFNTAI